MRSPELAIEQSTDERAEWIDRLRSALTVLVVAHHASLAYTTFASFDPRAYVNSTNPVVDDSRWVGMDVFVNFNDIFFMPLMFFISGLFVFRSWLKKGKMIFLRDRAKRLGIPFIVCAVLIIPVAYLPSYALSGHDFTVAAFLEDYVFVQQWPAGPLWFIWTLLLFQGVATALPSGWFYKIEVATSDSLKKPIRFLITIFLILLVMLAPLSLWLGQYHWVSWGPFDVQINRALLYFSFFIFGVSLGSGSWENRLFTEKRLLNRRWQFWLTLCFAAYLLVELVTYSIWEVVRTGTLSGWAAWLIFDVTFVASCICSCVAFLAVFRHFVRTSDVMKSLSSNAFGIYLIHYPFTTTLQLSLLDYEFHVVFKFLIVFTASLVLSWITVTLLRRIKVVRSVI